MKIILRGKSLPAITALVFALCAPPAQATLLTSAYETQLESWLGQGNLDFTNIYTKATGDDSFDFHAAADGQGATFVLMNIYGNGAGGPGLANQIVGGYNPQSWSTINSYNFTPNDVDRTAFIFNLSSGTIQRQNLTGEGASIWTGEFQTYNGSSYGPAFGTGFDLGVYFNLNLGQAYNYSYGGTTLGNEIVLGGPTSGDFSYFSVGELEVYTFAAAPGGGNVPDAAATLGLLGFSLLGLIAARRRLG